MTVKSAHTLICRTDNIGDVVLTLPITAYLKQHYPEIKISFLCRSYAASIVKACGSVDHVITLESLVNPVGFFRASGIDTIIFAQPHKALAIAAHKAAIPNRIGNTHRNFFHWLHCNYRVRFHKAKSDYHEAQLNFEFLRPFGINIVPARSEIPNLYEFKIPADPVVQQSLAEHRFNVILHPKSNGHGREWPIEHYIALAQMLSEEKNIHLWITGSVAEGQWIAENAAQLFALPNVSNVCGKFTLDQLTAFIQGVDGLVASGTGPLHISAAIGQRTLGLFPPTPSMHPGRWAPLGKRAQVLCQSVSCKGCKDIKTATCDCMRNITPESAVAIILEWLNQTKASRQAA